MGGGKALSKVWTPKLRALYHAGSRFLLDLSMDPSAHGDYGAPENVSVSVNVSAGQLEIGVVALDKTPTRLPEAAFVSFEPGTGNWSHEVLGGVVSLLPFCLVPLPGL